MMAMARKSLGISLALATRRRQFPTKYYTFLQKSGAHTEKIEPEVNKGEKQGENKSKCLPLSDIFMKRRPLLQNYPAEEETPQNKDLTEFLAMFPEVVNDLIDPENNHETKDANNRLKTVIESNVYGGSFLRVLSLTKSYKLLEQPQNLTPDNLKLAHILSWCLEIHQMSILILDDIFDASETRRGRVCWHLQDGVGSLAINDAILLENGAYLLLKKHFRDKPYYSDIQDLLHQVIFNLYKGQCLDSLLSGKFTHQLDVNRFTFDQVNAIGKYKTSFFTIVCPVFAAMTMAGIKDPDLYRQAENILFPIGCLYQVENDYLDCYGDLSVSKKLGNDIQSGKCTWLVAKALQKCTPEQREMLQNCYGTEDAENVARVRALYDELGLRQDCEDYIKRNCNEIRSKIENLTSQLPREMFHMLLERFKTF